MTFDLSGGGAGFRFPTLPVFDASHYRSGRGSAKIGLAVASCLEGEREGDFPAPAC
jgi:hypothetical protein